MGRVEAERASKKERGKKRGSPDYEEKNRERRTKEG